MSSEEQQIPVQDDGEAQIDSNVDAQGEDELTSQSEQKQLRKEAGDLDESNILDDS